MKKFEGAGGLVSATVIADSTMHNGTRMRTFEIECPRIILSENNTHRMLSKNSASSRAIPFAKMQEQLTGRPVRFGQANPGMQDKGVDYDEPVMGMPPKLAWEHACADAAFWSEAFFTAGYHKQVYNRLTEPFQMMKTVVSGTEFNNFFWLRDDDAADPTIAALARVMKQAQDASEPFFLEPGEWHLPYVDSWREADGTMTYYIKDDEGVATWLDVEDAKKVSAARCAAVSFRNTDYTLEKSLQVFDRLVGDERKHASAFEHQATPMKPKTTAWLYIWDTNPPTPTDYDMRNCINFAEPETWEVGVTHMDRNFDLWSGNLKDWIQFRKLIPGESKPG